MPKIIRIEDKVYRAYNTFESVARTRGNYPSIFYSKGILCDVMLKNPTYETLYEGFKRVCEVVNKRKRVRTIGVESFGDIIFKILYEREGYGWAHGGHKYPRRWVWKCTSSRVWWAWYTKGQTKYVRILGDRPYLSTRGYVLSPLNTRYKYIFSGGILTPFWIVFPERQLKMYILRERRLVRFFKKREINISYIGLASDIYPLSLFKVFLLSEREIMGACPDKVVWLIMNLERKGSKSIAVRLPRKFGPWSKFYQKRTKDQILQEGKKFTMELLLKREGIDELVKPT